MSNLFRLTVFLLIFPFSIVAQRLHPVDVNGALSVSGNQLVNKAGVPPQLRGVSLSWSLWAGKKYYNHNVVNWLTTDFHITLLRASMAVQPDGGYLQNPEEQTSLMMEVIDQSIKNGIYVLIDWHDHNACQHLEASRNFFKAMAKKYSGVPNVIYEIFNEPVRVSWSEVKTYSVEVIKTIRTYDKKNVIVVGSPHWDQDVDSAAADPITGFENVAYSFHFYASDPYHQEKLRAKADLALKMGLPLFITEWGVGESTGDGEFNHDKTAVWMEWMERNKLSWVAWNVTDKKETTAMLLKGASAKGNWKDENLTESGKYIRERLRQLNH